MGLSKKLIHENENENENVMNNEDTSQSYWCGRMGQREVRILLHKGD
jgi:hypothetical protein